MENVEDAVSIKEVLWSQEDAISEVNRLNQLNADKNMYYFWQSTRLVQLS